jgi:hypothetical protein
MGVLSEAETAWISASISSLSAHWLWDLIVRHQAFVINLSLL